MVRIASEASRKHRWTTGLAATSALALVFAASPLGLGFSDTGVALTSQAAQAKNDGDNGNAGGNGGGNDNGNAGGNGGGAENAGDRGNGGGKDGDHGKGGGNGKDNAGAKANGAGKAAAPGQAKKDEVGGVAYTFSKKEADLLLAKGWGKAAGSANHGQTVSTYVHIAKALGYSARDGALQANFMPPEWYATQKEWRDAQAALDAYLLADPAAQAALTAYEAAVAALAADPTNVALQTAVATTLAALNATEYDEKAAVVAEFELALDGMVTDIPDWKPGNGPQGDTWATVNLDYNGDGVVDTQDADDKAAGVPEAEFYFPTL